MEKWDINLISKVVVGIALFLALGFLLLLVTGSFSILNAMVANFQNTLNLNLRMPFNGTVANFSDAAFMVSYMEVLTYTASTTFLVGIIQVGNTLGYWLSFLKCYIFLQKAFHSLKLVCEIND